MVDQALETMPGIFLIELGISESNQIIVILDGDNGVSVSDCIAMSRAVEHNLDREEHDFSLEVTSVGVSSPLAIPRQYQKNIGRKLKVRTTTGEQLEGTLEQASETDCKITWKTREPKPVGKGKVTVQKEAMLPYGDIAEAKVMINFN